MDSSDSCYTSDTYTLEKNGRTYLIENKVPVLTDDEKQHRTMNIGAALFDIFSKHR